MKILYFIFITLHINLSSKDLKEFNENDIVIQFKNCFEIDLTKDNLKNFDQYSNNVFFRSFFNILKDKCDLVIDSKIDNIFIDNKNLFNNSLVLHSKINPTCNNKNNSLLCSFKLDNTLILSKDKNNLNFKNYEIESHFIQNNSKYFFIEYVESNEENDQEKQFMLSFCDPDFTYYNEYKCFHYEYINGTLVDRKKIKSYDYLFVNFSPEFHYFMLNEMKEDLSKNPKITFENFDKFIYVKFHYLYNQFKNKNFNFSNKKLNSKFLKSLIIKKAKQISKELNVNNVDQFIEANIKNGNENIKFDKKYLDDVSFLFNFYSNLEVFMSHDNGK